MFYSDCKAWGWFQNGRQWLQLSLDTKRGWAALREQLSSFFYTSQAPHFTTSLTIPQYKTRRALWSPVFGWICVVLGRHRLSTPCVSMSRIWQVAVKELYVFTEFMRLLGIQLFSIKSYSSCEIFLRLALEGGKATPAKAPSSTSPRSNLPREIWPSASVRTRGRDILVKTKTKILVKPLSRSPEVSPPGRCPTDWSLSPLLRVLLEIGFVPGRCRWEVSNRRMLPILRLGRGPRTLRGNGKRPVTDPGSSIMGRAGTKFAIVAKCDGLIITGL